MNIRQDLIRSVTTHEATLDNGALREALGLPDGSTIEYVPDGGPGFGFVRVTWQGVAEAAPKPEPKKNGKAKKEEPAAPVEVPTDWKGALDPNRPTAVDIRKAEEEAGTARVAEVRAKLQIGPGVTAPMIALQSNGPAYFAELRAVGGAK